MTTPNPYAQPYPPVIPAVPPPAPRRTTRLFLGLAVGLVIGGGGVGAVWAFGGGDEGVGAASDARGACRALDTFEPPDLEHMKKGDKGPGIQLNRLGAATALAQAASDGDAGYRPLYKSLQRTMGLYSQFGRLDKEAGAELEKSRKLCADI
ncbi:hypothetical protein SRB5_58910 [Streptomyces sp. RB5]|uniref:Uncharacterized protein n=1 Tax=Streptomyces smaragdinus TaxID=2585196 RepID=A0A7K0CQV1_9ACTN|nr:hypothetical protein [Streptomyces smaragdinus]MQY15703.1 hypothetical protein [Streptomyces smaragdinus]